MNSHNEYINAIKTKYDFKRWSSQIKIPGKFSKKYLPSHNAIDGFVHIKRKPVANTNHAFTDYFQHIKNKEIAVAVTVFEYKSTSETHEHLALTLCHCAAPEIPRCEKKNIIVGDIAFCGSQEIQTSIFYVRNNVFIKIESVGKKPYHVAELAQTIDKQIINNLV